MLKCVSFKKVMRFSLPCRGYFLCYQARTDYTMLNAVLTACAKQRDQTRADAVLQEMLEAMGRILLLLSHSNNDDSGAKHSDVHFHVRQGPPWIQ